MGRRLELTTIAIPRERRPAERRIAASPETVKKFQALGLKVIVEAGAGAGCDIPDAAFAEAGARLADSEEEVLAAADVVLKVQRPLDAGEGGPDELALMTSGTVLVGLLAPLGHRHQVAAYARHGITAFALELLPRITRAQSMDALSSQANLSGYRAVLDATAVYARAMPMMMTAAGTVAPARVLVLGAGVAGLQAIATARRLGAIVSAFDVRPAVKEEVESLGATFIEVPSDEAESVQTEGGYAREMGEDYKRRQSELIHEHLKKQDIVICTALIPGRPAPRLVTGDMVADMKPGSVIVDLAIETGGNAAHAKVDEVVEVGGVRIIAHGNVPSRIAVDASHLYARNLLNFLTPMIDAEHGSLKIDRDDEIIQGALLTCAGEIVHPLLKDEGA